MFAYIVKRLLLMLVTLFGIIVLTFAITRLAPGDPAMLEAQSGGMTTEGQASLDEMIKQNRIIYGLDKPLVFNFAGEERSWFVREKLNQSLFGETDFDRRFASRELSELGTAGYPSFVELMDELATRAGDVPYPSEKWEKYREVRRARRLARTEEEERRAGELPEFADAEMAALKLGQLLDLMNKVVRHDLPAGFARSPRHGQVSYWRDWWSDYVPDGIDPEEYAARLVSEALASGDAARLAQLVSRGTFVSVPLIERILDYPSDPLRMALLLHLLSEAERKPAWRANARLAASTLGDLALPAAPTKRAELQRNFIEVAPDWLSEAFRQPESEESRRTIAERADFWLAPVFVNRIYNSFDPDVQDLALFGLRQSLKDAPETNAEDLLRELNDEKYSLVRRWWSRAKFQRREFTPLAHSWHFFSNTQFGIWMGKIVRLDFDVSIKHNRPVLDLIAERLPITLFFSFASILLAYMVAIPLGIFSSVKMDTFADKAQTLVLFILYSLPNFWLADMLILFLTGGDWYDIFDAEGIGDPNLVWAWGQWSSNWIYLKDRVAHLTLPLICYTYASFAFLSRQMRSAMLETVRQDFIRTARAKGLTERAVIFKHALRNSLIPILTLSAGLLPQLIGGSVIIEQIFTIRGMGLLSYEALLNRDYAIINAIAIFTAGLTLLGILLADLSYAIADPRITYE